MQNKLEISEVLSLATSIISYFSSHLWPVIPKWVAYLGTGIGIFLAGLFFGLIINKKTKKSPFSTFISFHLYGDERIPKIISSDNIWRWYWLRNIFRSIDNNGEVYEATTVNLFIAFDIPVKVGTVELNSPDIKLPKHEVKELNPRFCIIVFETHPTSGTLDIKVI